MCPATSRNRHGQLHRPRPCGLDSFIDLAPADWTIMLEVLGAPELETAELITVEQELWHPIAERLGIAHRYNSLKVVMHKTPGRDMAGSEDLAQMQGNTLGGLEPSTPGSDMMGSENLALPGTDTPRTITNGTHRTPGQDMLTSETIAQPEGKTFDLVARPGWHGMRRIVELCQQESSIISVTLAEAPALYGYANDTNKTIDSSRVEKDRRIFKK